MVEAIIDETSIKSTFCFPVIRKINQETNNF